MSAASRGVVKQIGEGVAVGVACADQAGKLQYVAGVRRHGRIGTDTTGALLTLVGPLTCRDDQPLNLPSVAPISRSSELPTAAGTNVTCDSCDAGTAKIAPAAFTTPFTSKCPPPAVE